MPPEPQPFPALITTPCQVWRRWIYTLPYYSVYAADTLLYAVILTFDSATLTFDLWPWTFAARIVCDVMKLCTKFATQSNNPRWSYCDFSVWPYDLEHVLSVALALHGIIFTKFDLRQLIRAWIIAFLMLVSYVKLWPWPLTCWPWKFVVKWSKSVRNLSEIEQSLAKLLIILRIFAHVMSRRDLDLWLLDLELL